MKQSKNVGIKPAARTNKNLTTAFIGVGCIIFGLLSFFTYSRLTPKPKMQTTAAIVKESDMKILADGMVRSENETTLHFAVGGKLTYLPFKEGDRVSRGQTIASIDTYVLQRQLTAALNSYRSVRDSFDQQNQNDQTGYLDAQLGNNYPLNYWNIAGITGQQKVDEINNMIKRLNDQAQAGLDNSVIQVEIANYALSLASIQAPFDGVITHMDVTSAGVMVGPTAGFTIINDATYVFRANVPENDIHFIGENGPASIKLAGNESTISGIISTIYPDKVTLPTGESVYQVDITAEGLNAAAKYRQDGTALIDNNYHQTITLVPTWLILSKKYVWVNLQGTPTLKEITIGRTLGQYTEVTGLETGELITNPESVVSKKYSIL